jgi:2-phospho-L-lactate transferase/gluconeogenesis factor (CofD/UPF0052 family)
MHINTSPEINHYPTEPEQLRIVAFCGGGGSVMTRGLVETMPGADITIVVPTGDGGSKTGELRDVFGGPAIGDLRKNLGAVADPGVAELFDDEVGRFGSTATNATITILHRTLLRDMERRGMDTTRAANLLGDIMEQANHLPNGLESHTYTNLLLNALRLKNGGQLSNAALEMASWIGAPKNVRILPVTEESHNVVMHDRHSGIILVGEGLVDAYDPAVPEEVDVWLEAGPAESKFIEAPEAVAGYLAARETRRRPRANPKVVGRIATSHAAILAPGCDLTTQRPALLPDGISQALRMQQERDGRWVVIANLYAEKPGMTLDKHLKGILAVSGRAITHLVHNTDTDGIPEGKVPLRYEPGDFDLGDARAIGAALIDGHVVEHSANDPVAQAGLRSLKHHDVWRVAGLLVDEVIAYIDRQPTSQRVHA